MQRSRLKNLSERSLSHMRLWDWLCSAKAREEGYGIITIRLGGTLLEAVEMIQDVPGNFVCIQGVCDLPREAWGILATDRPKQILDWDFCYFVGFFREGNTVEKVVTGLSELSEFLSDGSYRIGMVAMLGKNGVEEVAKASFINAAIEEGIF